MNNNTHVKSWCSIPTFTLCVSSRQKLLSLSLNQEGVSLFLFEEVDYIQGLKSLTPKGPYFPLETQTPALVCTSMRRTFVKHVDERTTRVAQTLASRRCGLVAVNNGGASLF